MNKRTIIMKGNKRLSISEQLQNNKDLERLQALRYIDDDFMTVCLEDNFEAVELILRIILNQDDIIIKSIKTQDPLKNLQGRSAVLDVHASDSTGRKFDIEIQRANKGAGSKRARYNSSLLDAHILKPGESTDNMPDSYVIFITENDVMKADLPIYHIDRVVKETGKLFKDEAHIIYVNSQIKDAFSENQRREKTFSTWGQWKNDPQHRNTNRNYSDYPSNHHHLNGRQYHSCPAKQGHRKPDGCGFEPGHTIF